MRHVPVLKLDDDSAHAGMSANPLHVIMQSMQSMCQMMMQGSSENSRSSQVGTHVALDRSTIRIKERPSGENEWQKQGRTQPATAAAASAKEEVAGAASEVNEDSEVEASTAEDPLVQLREMQAGMEKDAEEAKKAKDAC